MHTKKAIIQTLCLMMTWAFGFMYMIITFKFEIDHVHKITPYLVVYIHYQE